MHKVENINNTLFIQCIAITEPEIVGHTGASVVLQKLQSFLWYTYILHTSLWSMHTYISDLLVTCHCNYTCTMRAHNVQKSLEWLYVYVPWMRWKSVCNRCRHACTWYATVIGVITVTHYTLSHVRTYVSLLQVDYEVCHDVLVSYLESFDTYANFK